MTQDGVSIWPHRLSDEDYRTHWIARVRAKCIDNDRGCWHWTGHVGSKGYGQTTYRGHGNADLHRRMYEVWHRVELAYGQQVCHSCDNRRCCNPEHLWVGDSTANRRDQLAKGRDYFSALTHCKRGHEFTPENTYMRRPYGKKGPSRVCRACQRLRNREAA